MENIRIWPTKGTVNLVEKPEKPILIDLTFESLKSSIKKGDTVILLPVFDPPELTKKDSAGNYLASGLILRRVGGITAFNQK